MNAKGLVFAILLSWPGWVAACESLLRASPHLVATDQYSLSPAANADLGELGITVREFISYLKSNFYVPVQEDETRFWMVVFKPDRDLRDNHFMDKGYTVLGRKVNGTYRIEHIDSSEHEYEQTYFKRVSTMHQVQQAVVDLQHEVLRCRGVFVKPWVQMKLWVKHRLRLQDLKRIFESPEDGPFRDNSHGHGDFFVLRGHAKDGRMIRAILSLDRKNCPLNLVTAFEENR